MQLPCLSRDRHAMDDHVVQVEVTLQGQSHMLLAPGAKASKPSVAAPATADKAVGASGRQPLGESNKEPATDIAAGRREKSMGLSDLPPTIGVCFLFPA